MAIKKNCGKLYPQARALLGEAKVVASSHEQARGEQVIRELRRVSAPQTASLPGLTELWSVRQTRTKGDRWTVDERVFAVSIPPEELTGEEKLRLVRLHWGIENGANWTSDMLLKEDTRMPCTIGKAVLVLGWLHLLAYNLLAVFRAHLPQKDRRPEAWTRAAELLHQTLLMLDLVGETEPAATIC